MQFSLNLDREKIGPPISFLYLGFGKYSYQEYKDSVFCILFHATSDRNYTVLAGEFQTKTAAIRYALEDAKKRLLDGF